MEQVQLVPEQDSFVVKGAAAGVLIYRIFNQKIYVLLGAERRRPGFDAGGLWCDFGGAVDPSVSAYVGACKEFIEESMGVFGTDTNTMEAFMKEKTVCVVQSMYGIKRPYILYIVRYDGDASKQIQQFDTRFKIAMKVWTGETTDSSDLPSEAIKHNGKIRKNWVEKTTLQWFDFDNLCNGLNNNVRKEFSDTLNHKIVKSFFTSEKRNVNTENAESSGGAF